MQNRDQLYINSQWAVSAGENMIDVHCASTEEVIGRELGRPGHEEFLECKAIQLRTEART